MAKANECAYVCVYGMQDFSFIIIISNQFIKMKHNENDRGCEYCHFIPKGHKIYMKLIDKLFILAINDKITYVSPIDSKKIPKRWQFIK